jgi:hypothetical protein
MDSNKIEEYKKRKSFALEYGTLLGASWVVVFVAYIIGIRTFNPLIMMLCYGGLFAIALLPFILAYRYKKKHTLPEESITYGEGMHFCILMFSYAILLTGIAEYIYFAFIDNGAIVSALSSYFTNPEMIQALNDLNMNDMKDMMMENINALSAISPFDITLSLAQINITISIFMIFIVAAIMKK